MKIKPLSICLFLLLLLFSISDITYAETSLSEKQALNVLISHIQKDKLYDSWTTLSCLSFLTEEKTKDHFDFVIREKHGGKCQGDPNTSPIVDRFRVDRLTKKIQWYEPTDGAHLPYKAVLKARLKK